jgi:hypothetical protein
MRLNRIMSVLVMAAATSVTATSVSAAPVTFEKLSGVTGGSLAATAVFRADLSSFNQDILSISITDGQTGLGAPGQFSGFDLDAIVLSTTLCETAVCAKGLTGLNVFDFSPGGTLFTPGTQLPPTDAKLFGTGPAGNTVDNAVATLGSFDAESTTAIPGAFGFVSMGEGGRLVFNLTSAVTTAGLYLYIGEVGDNGEVAAGQITLSSTPVPEPTAGLLLAAGCALFMGYRRRQG